MGACADTAVDVEPQTLLGGDLRKRGEIVYRAGIDCPGGTDDAGGLHAARAVLGDRSAECRKVDPVAGIGRESSQRLVAEPERLDRLAMAGMDLVGRIEAQGFFERRKPLFAQIDSRHGVAGNRQADKVGHRTALATHIHRIRAIAHWKVATGAVA